MQDNQMARVLVAIGNGLLVTARSYSLPVSRFVTDALQVKALEACVI